MFSKVDPINIGENIRLHVIKTEKFKTNLMSIYLQRPLLENEVTNNALLSMVLPRGTVSYPSSRDMSRTLEGLYGASVGSDVSKKGERNILQFRLQLINDRFIEEKNTFIKGLNILNELINKPLIVEDSFNDQYFNQEKSNLNEKIEGRKNDKMKYAYDRCIEEMCKHEKYSLFEYGDLNELKTIDSKSLFTHYKKIVKSSPIDICVIGDIKEKDVEQMVRDNLMLTVKDPINIERENIIHDVSNIKTINEEMDVNQGKLTLGYRTNIPFESELYEPLVLYSNILGGGPNSKLFKNVREKESLCYYIFSRIEKFKSLLLISSGIEFESYDKALDIIDKQVNDMNNGNFTHDDMESAKNSIITSIRSMTDSPAMLSDFFYTQVISNNQESLEGIINKIKNVKKEQVIEAGKRIQLDTIYFLKNKGEGK